MCIVCHTDKGWFLREFIIIRREEDYCLGSEWDSQFGCISGDPNVVFQSKAYVVETVLFTENNRMFIEYHHYKPQLNIMFYE